MASDSNFDIKAHERTYGKVIRMLGYGAVACGIVAALVIWLIAS